MTDGHKSNAANAPQDSPGKKPRENGTLPKTEIALLVSVAVALSMLFVGALLVWLWRDSLPDPIAVHWGTVGEPDGFASPAGFIWPLVGLMGGAILLMAAIGFSAKNTSASMIAILNGTIVFLGAMGLLLTIFSVGPQRGLISATEARLSWWELAAVLGGSALLGVVAAVISPRVTVPDASSGPGKNAARAFLPEDEVVLWIGKTSMRPAGLWGFIGLMAVLLGGTGVSTGSWVPFFVTVPILIFIALMSVFTIRIGPDGFFVKSLLGWPKKQVPSFQINEADTVEVHPFQQFGGWGYRFQTDGTEGIVLRKGPGVRIRYGNTNELVVTLNSGAEEAAALLNTYADRAQEEGR